MIVEDDDWRKKTMITKTLEIDISSKIITPIFKTLTYKDLALCPRNMNKTELMYVSWLSALKERRGGPL
jgi:hypothetical protein